MPAWSPSEPRLAAGGPDPNPFLEHRATMVERKIERLVVGIEVGTSAVKAVLGMVTPGQPIQVIGAGRQPLDGQMLKGDAVDNMALSAPILAAVRQAERQAGHAVYHDTVICVAFTGSHMQGVTAEGVWPLPDGEVTQEAIEYAQEFADARVLSTRANANYALVQGFDRMYLVDGKPVDSDNLLGDDKDASPSQGTELRVLRHAFLARTDRIKTILQATAAAFDRVSINIYCFSGFASVLATTRNEDILSGILTIDIGAGCTEYLLARQGRVWHSGTVAVGTLHVANDLMIAFGLESVEAGEQLLRRLPEFGSAVRTDDGTNRMLSATDIGLALKRPIAMSDVELVIESRLSELFEIIYEKLQRDGAELPETIPSGVRITGGGANIHGIDTLATRLFRTPVRRSEPIQYVFADPRLESELQSPVWATPLGLLRFTELPPEECASMNQDQKQSWMEIFWEQLSDLNRWFRRHTRC
jgi:cell division protein FtsA